MMDGELWHILATFVDLLGLALCLGALVCRLWVLPPELTRPGSPAARALLSPVWRLLGGAILLLAVATVSQFLLRVASMTGRPMSEIGPLVPTILLQTHYGRVWILRTTVVLVLLAVWWLEKRDRCERRVTVLMLAFAAVIGLTRSLTGHAADWGDPSFAELFDWTHLCAASAWGGSLWVFTLCIFPATLESLDEHGKVFAAMVSRLSVVSGIALGALVGSAIANAYYEVGDLQGLVGTSYGRIILIKGLFLGMLVILGASNRYISVPILQAWAGSPPARHGVLFQLLWGGWLTQLPDHAEILRVVRRFALKVQVEALLIGLVLFLTAVLLHHVPAAHLAHMRG